MSETPKPGQGRLYDNRPTRTSQRQPDYVGTINIDGELYRLSGWFNPPSERVRVATIGIKLESPDEQRARRALETEQRNNRPARRTATTGRSGESHD